MNTISPIKLRQDIMYVSTVNKRHQDANNTPITPSFKGEFKKSQLKNFVMTGLSAAVAYFSLLKTQKNNDKTPQDNAADTAPQGSATDNDIAPLIEHYFREVRYVPPVHREYVISELKKYPHLFDQVKSMEEIDDILEFLEVNSKHPKLTGYYIKTGMKFSSDQLEQLEQTRNNYQESIDKLINSEKPYSYKKIIAYAPEYEQYGKSIDKIESMIKSLNTMVCRKNAKNECYINIGDNNGKSDQLEIFPIEILDVAKLHYENPELIEKTLDTFNILNADFINVAKNHVDSPLKELILGRIGGFYSADKIYNNDFFESINELINNIDVISVLKPIIDSYYNNLSPSTGKRDLLEWKYRAIEHFLKNEGELISKIREFLPNLMNNEYDNIDMLIAHIIKDSLFKNEEYTLTDSQMAQLLEDIKNSSRWFRCFPPNNCLNINTYRSLSNDLYLEKAYKINPDMTKELSDLRKYFNSVIYCIVQENETDQNLAYELAKILNKSTIKDKRSDASAPLIEDVKYFISKYKEAPDVTLNKYKEICNSYYTQSESFKILKLYDKNEKLASRLTSQDYSLEKIEKIFIYEKNSEIILKILDIITNPKDSEKSINILTLPIESLIKQYKLNPESTEEVLKSYMRIRDKMPGLVLNLDALVDLIELHAQSSAEDKEKICDIMKRYNCTNIKFILAYKDLPMRAYHHWTVYLEQTRKDWPISTNISVDQKELNYVKKAIELDPIIEPLIRNYNIDLEICYAKEFDTIKRYGDLLLRTINRIQKDGRMPSDIDELVSLAKIYDENPNIEITDKHIEEYTDNPYLRHIFNK